MCYFRRQQHTCVLLRILKMINYQLNVQNIRKLLRREAAKTTVYLILSIIAV